MSLVLDELRRKIVRTKPEILGRRALDVMTWAQSRLVTSERLIKHADKAGVQLQRAEAERIALITVLEGLAGSWDTAASETE